MAGLLFLVESQASDVADRSALQGFLSKDIPAGFDAPSSMSDYDKFITPSMGVGPFRIVDDKTKDVNPPTIADRELINYSINPITLSAIGIGLLSLVTLLGVRLRRGLQPVTVLANSSGSGPLMPMNTASALGDNVMEMKTQDKVNNSRVGWGQLSSQNSHPSTVRYAGNPQPREGIRNVAIVAHVDHGKTTLVDALLQESNVFRDNEDVQERVMDSNDQERERGITILAKNAAIDYKGIKVNVVDTPGHADFGGEVERILNMVDGVLLVVDSVEGPKPQTRFVLKKALELGLKPVVVVNKIDRPQARPDYVVDKVFDLFVELDATDDQTDFDIVYASAINGQSGTEPDELQKSMTPILDAIIDSIPAPNVDVEAPAQLLVANIDFDDFKGKLGIGRIKQGKLKAGDAGTFGAMKGPDDECRGIKINDLFVYDNLGRKAVEEASAGEIVMFSGVADIQIGETVVEKKNPAPLPCLEVEEPTVSMSFAVNKSPLAGREGDKLTSRVIRDRLMKELDRNVALQVEPQDSGDAFTVSGRGPLHLTVLIETMRREGFELEIGPPEVIIKEVDGKKQEPYDAIEVQVPDEYSSSVVDLLNQRKGEMQDMGKTDVGDYTYVKYLLPTRGSIGLRTNLMSATRGTAVIDSNFDSYRPFAGDIAAREKGSLLAFEDGVATSNGLLGAQDRGQLFATPKTVVYKDMVVGVHQRPGDLRVNVCKQKQLTNMRSATKGIVEGLTPPLELTLDSAVEYISQEELVEVTPESIRMAKQRGLKKSK
jgi:GTP-binding protein